jgi:hypothetical protein
MSVILIARCLDPTLKGSCRWMSRVRVNLVDVEAGAC